jgi:hypothetical protein
MKVDRMKVLDADLRQMPCKQQELLTKRICKEFPRGHSRHTSLVFIQASSLQKSSF